MATKISEDFIQNKVTTSDGISLSYYTIGTDPGLLLLHGSISYGMTHRELAALLSKSFTVHLLSRRSRGLSGPNPASVATMEAVTTLCKLPEGDSVSTITIGGVSAIRTYDPAFSSAVMEVELSYLDPVLKTTKSIFALGVSSGALVLLAAFLCSQRLPAFSGAQKLVIFEPPMQFADIDTGLDVMGARRYEEEMKVGDVAAAMVTTMKLVQLGPGKKKKLSQDGGEVDLRDEGKSTMLKLAPILRYDFAIAEHMVGVADRFIGIGNNRSILLMTGSNSPAYLKMAIDKLEATITRVQRVTIEGVGHEVLCNKNFRGRSERVIGIINDFLTT